jgi:hypothetical protein
MMFVGAGRWYDAPVCVSLHENEDTSTPVDTENIRRSSSDSTNAVRRTRTARSFDSELRDRDGLKSGEDIDSSPSG